MAACQQWIYVCIFENMFSRFQWCDSFRPFAICINIEGKLMSKSLTDNSIFENLLNEKIKHIFQITPSKTVDSKWILWRVVFALCACSSLFWGQSFQLMFKVDVLDISSDSKFACVFFHSLLDLDGSGIWLCCQQLTIFHCHELPSPISNQQ